MTIKEIFRLLLIQYKKIVSVTLISTTLLFLVFVTIYPVSYESTVSILPPDSKTNLGLSSLLQGADFSTLLTAPGGANAQLYAEILRSRSASEYVVEKLNLINFFDVNNSVQASDKLLKKIFVEVTKEGVIKLSVPISTSWFGGLTSEADTIKNLSAAISNSFAEALDAINRRKLASKSKKARMYIEGQIALTKTRLDSTESALMVFQKDNKTISLTDQLKVSIETAAKLKGEIINTEIKLGVLSQNLNENNSEVLGLKKKLNELNQQYYKLESTSNDFLLAFKDAPEIGLKLSSLYREVRILNEVYLLLQQQYYKEKIQENKDLPTVEILDAAIPPTRASSPRILLFTFFSGVFVFLAISLIVVIENRVMYKYTNKDKNKDKVHNV